ncbi:hypothetical protein EST38_g3989 [Candolleomyces aberdarensis]|uniref:3'-5' exonuclease domain-containing protein n=1 Tax=Candolleomyces aberdarensis TaxID=2316362 RepID=A0A4Q2DPC3_9AGAR|nr:hypothetical protein EST38_g3989 [Candolleomyces aberdarensis]
MTSAQPITRIADTLALVEDCIQDLISHPTTTLQPCIAVDLEGVDLSRHGRVCLVQMKANHSRIIWLLDVTVLGRTAFDHPSSDGTTVRDILESASIKKMFFDVRRDAEALYHIYGVDMHNVCDLQIVELAARQSNRNRTQFVKGLARTITDYLSPGPQWTQIKERGVALFSPRQGGSFEAFERRPLDPTIAEYSAQDVALLADLEARMMSRFGSFTSSRYSWGHRIQVASEKRLVEAKSPIYAQEGRERALAPVI